MDITSVISDILIYNLLIFPIIASITMLFVKNFNVRRVLVYIFSGVIAASSIILIALNLVKENYVLPISEDAISIFYYFNIVVSVVIAATIIYYGIKHKNVLAIVLAVIQLLATLFVEFMVVPFLNLTGGHLHLDAFGLVMVFIVGIVGSAICVYSLGYMKDHATHLKEGEKDYSNTFFALLYIFLSAMFLIVFAEDLSWMFLGWEATSLCSFLLIRYTRTKEAIKNSFKQINMNLLGGIAFTIGIYLCLTGFSINSFTAFLEYGINNPDQVAIVVWLFSFAAIIKAAQMPFHTWLLGAMVAPSPTSALLHSSTMVKAGVFLLVKLSPIYYNFSIKGVIPLSSPGIVLMLVGGISFFACSILAITQTNAKKVLAYSTISNLGLIVACAAYGSPTAIWAAIFLILFHACAKSLLFLCVGTAQHKNNSLNIEDMDEIFADSPTLAKFMIVGMMVMFIAPFGMLVSKWAALSAFIQTNQIVLILILAFGSAFTFLFWAKWIAKLSRIAFKSKLSKFKINKSELVSFITILSCIIFILLTFQLISGVIVQHYSLEIYSAFGNDLLYYFYQYGLFNDPISYDSIFICAVSSLVVIVILLVKPNKQGSYKKVNTYLAGVSTSDKTNTFKGSFGDKVKATSKNMYLNDFIKESYIKTFFVIFSIVLLSFSFVMSMLLTFGVFTAVG